MNDNLNKKIAESNKTLYTISKESGIPYTTLRELAAKKTNVNNCTAETILILSLYLGCEMKDLLDQAPLIANSSGKYRGIKYKWIYSQKHEMELHVWDKHEEKIIDSGGAFNQIRFYHAYRDMTETLIDDYIEKMESERMLYG